MESKRCLGTPQNVSTSKQTNVYDFENLKKEIDVLRNENTILKGRLRGIETLGDLLQEARETNHTLTEQKNKLQQRLNDSLNEKLKNRVVSSGEVITSISDIGQIYQPNTTGTTETNDLELVQPAASNPVQESATVILSVTESGIMSRNSSHITSKNNLPATAQVTTQTRVTENQVQPSDSINNDNQDIQYDSDKLEEPNYPKSDVNSLNIGSFSSPSFGEIASRSEASSTYDDQHNLTESLHIQSHFGSHDLQFNPSLCQSTVESLGSEKVHEMVSQYVGNAEKVNEKLKKYEGLYHVITKENGMIKKQMAVFKEENSKLLHRIRHLEQVRDNIETESLTRDWVHVSTNKKEEEVKRSSDYANAIKQIGELKTANKAWQTKWDSLEKQYSSRNRSLEKEIDSLKSEIKRLIKTHEENQLEADKMLMNAKQRVEEEEEGKMEAKDSLHKVNLHLNEVQKRVKKLESELGDVKRDKSIVESELSILRNDGQARDDDERNKDTIDVLKQQITICTEDFERERQDRAEAQSARSALQEENNQLLEDKQNLTAQVDRMNRQLQDAEIVHRRLETDNENHQTHIRTLKAETQRLRGKLESAQQQISSYTRTHSQVQNITPPLRESVHLPNPISPHIHSAPVAQNVPSRYREQQSLEHLPGAWTCSKCTYINYPGRTVCEICGSITGDGDSGYGNRHMQGLQPRGPLDYGHRDLEIDICQ